MNNRILFDASSTNPVSAVIAVAPGDCVLINAWNLGPGEVAEVFRLLVQNGTLPTATQGSCFPLTPVTPADILQEEPYVPCNAPVQVGQTVTQNITSIVLSQPGFYNLHLSPAALGTAFVEAVALTGADACEEAARACCCTPQQNFVGTSLSPCLSILPGGPNGLQPVFNLDPCCVLQQIVTPGTPNLADTIIVLQGGACVRATLQDVVDLVFVCGTLGTFPLQPFAPLDSLIAVDSGAACKRLDAAALVTGLETPWTGTSNNPNLTITPGGVNGHAPVFDYDWCADMQALPSCGCEPTPGDGVPILQGGACVLATWPTIDLCEQIGLLANGALLAGDTIPVREAGGACKQVLAASLQSGFDGGPINNPILAADGSCASPSYSFASSTDSGMWYDAGLGAVTISDDNCTDFIQVGASINVVSTASNISLQATAGAISNISSTFSAIAALGIALTTAAGNLAATATAGDVVLTAPAGEVQLTAGTNVEIRTATLLRLTFDFTGAWQLAGNPGVAGQVITSAGPGVPPTWAAASATVTFPLLAPTDPIPQFSFVAKPNMGMSYDGTSVNFGRYDGASWSSSAGLRIEQANPRDMFLEGEDNALTRGSKIEIRGGDSTAVVQGEGGGLLAYGGNGALAKGGDAEFGGGIGQDPALGVGGKASLLGGAGNFRPGSVLIRAGVGGGPGVYNSGGNIDFRTEAGNAGDATFPVIRFDHHASVQYGDSFVMSLASRPSATSFWYGIVGDTSNTRGQHLRIWGGPGVNLGAGGAGGNVDVEGGAASAGNNDGGQLTLAGGARTGTGIPGYVQLQRVTVAPVGAPNVVGGFAPIIMVDDGVTLELFGWMQSTATWRSTVLT